jgi:integrase/recombinase XerD
MMDRNTKPSSICTEIKNLKAFVTFLVRNKFLSENWGKELILPKVNIKQESLITAEIAEQVIIAGTEPGKSDNKFHRKQKQEMRFTMLFTLKIGLRFREVKLIQGKDLYLFQDPPKVSVHAKGGDIELQSIPPDIVADLKSKIERDRVFPICLDTCNKLLKRGLHALNIKNTELTFKTLRAIYANSLARNGATIYEVRRLMRHKNINTTEKFYLKYGIEDLANIQNTSHPLNRRGLDEETVIDTFMTLKVYPFFSVDKRFSVMGSEFEEENNTWVVRIKKNTQ